MRTLCLSFPESLDSDSVEKFTCLSPLVFYREPGLVFIEIQSTAHLFKGENHVLQKALRLAQHHHPQVRAGIGATPYAAQAMACSALGVSTQAAPADVHDLGSDAFGSLPLESLLHLEGLKSWESPRKVENIISVLEQMGLQSLAELRPIPVHQFRSRWGSLGTLLWKKLHLREEQLYSPWPLKHHFYSYIYFDFPVEVRQHLIGLLKDHLQTLFRRLESLRRFCRRIELTLHCEFSNVQHSLQIEPITASRDIKLFCDLLEKRLEKMDLSNPVRDVEIRIADTPEKVYQLDFFEPIDPSSNKWGRLISFCRQMGFEVGFLQPMPSHYPEQSYQLQSEWPEDRLPEDVIRKEDEAIQIKSVYSKALSTSPRPSLLLKEPRMMLKDELKQLRFLSSVPVERIGTDWWEDWKDQLREKVKGIKAAPKTHLSELKKRNPLNQSQGQTKRISPEKLTPPASRPPARDYYFAISPQGQWLWLYQEHQSKKFFLHGYFD